MADVATLGALVHERVLLVDRLASPGSSARVLQETEGLGGSALNLAVGLWSLGLMPRLFLSGGPGDQVAMKRAGLFEGQALVVEDEEQVTSTVVVGPDASSTVYFSTDLRPPFEQFQPERVCAFSGFTLLSDPQGFGALLQKAKKAGSFIALDAGPAAYHKGLLDDVLPHVHLLLLNQEEAQAYTERSDPSDQVLSVACQEVHVKLGPEGSVARRGPQLRQAPALPILAVDTTGSGDAYMAGAIAAAGKSLEESLQLANQMGGLAATVLGTGFRLIPAFRKKDGEMP